MAMLPKMKIAIGQGETITLDKFSGAIIKFLKIIYFEFIIQQFAWAFWLNLLCHLSNQQSSRSNVVSHQKVFLCREGFLLL